MDSKRYVYGYDYHLTQKGFIRPIDDLLHDQRKGKFLTPEEKKRLKIYSEERRIKNKSKKS